MSLETIWKTVLPVQDDIELELPKDAKILTVQVQHGDPCLWYACDPNNEKVTRVFRLAGTGHAITNGGELEYIGTFQLAGGAFVGHLFERA